MAFVTENRASRAAGKRPEGRGPNQQQGGPPANDPATAPRAFSGRSRLGQLTGVQILGVGSYAPEEEVRNEDLAELGYDADWIVQRTGILARRRAHPDQATSDLAWMAATRCLEHAGVGPEEVDLILVATMTPDYPTPSTACCLQERLGALAPAMDINAACAGFMYALVTGMHFIKAGCHQRVLVVGADLMSRVVDPADKKTFPLFGDGAGAVLLGPGQASQGLLAYTLGSEGVGGPLLCQPAGGTRQPPSPQAIAAGQQFLQMDGRAVFKWAVRVIQDASTDVLSYAQLAPAQLDAVVWHQANIRILDSALEGLGIAPEQVVVNLDRYGNTSAGSMPLVLDEAVRHGRIQRGDRVLVAGFGAGLAWGAGILQW